jgi:hypothetical protein
MVRPKEECGRRSGFPERRARGQAVWRAATRPPGMAKRVIPFPDRYGNNPAAGRGGAPAPPIRAGSSGYRLARRVPRPPSGRTNRSDGTREMTAWIEQWNNVMATFTTPWRGGSDAALPHPVMARSAATRPSPRRVQSPKRQSQRKSCLDCRGPAALAMTDRCVTAKGVTSWPSFISSCGARNAMVTPSPRHDKAQSAAATPHPVIARSVATWQSKRRFRSPKRQSQRKGRLDCRGPAALAMTDRCVMARGVMSWPPFISSCGARNAMVTPSPRHGKARNTMALPHPVIARSAATRQSRRRFQSPKTPKPAERPSEASRDVPMGAVLCNSPGCPARKF